MKKILVIEDDQIIAIGLQQALSHEGYSVDWARNGLEGVEKAFNGTIDLIILDVMMPEMNGFEVATELRRKGLKVPIIILSARSESVDKVRGLDLGADDYMTKPFDLHELLARVRRRLGRETEKIDSFGYFEYVWKTQVLLDTRTDKPITLSSRERRVLEYFLRNKEQIITREQLLDNAWGGSYEGTDRTVDNVIVSLRKRTHSNHILTERGLGYRFVTKT